MVLIPDHCLSINMDENKYVAAILMDLSRAFDCLLHDLLLLKIKYYGVSNSALDLVQRQGIIYVILKQCIMVYHKAQFKGHLTS